MEDLNFEEQPKTEEDPVVNGDGAPDWVPDDEVVECQGCLRMFTVTFRRHHCRGCGKIFCKVCSNQECLLPVSYGIQSGPKRVCDKCSKKYFPFDSFIAVTPSGGKIEFGRMGKGDNIILSFHGGPGSYSQGLALSYLFYESESLFDKYTVIAPSRPGYANTAIEMGETPDKAAEMCIQLLDEIGIPREKKLTIIGFSAGGPTSIEFCLKYPERVSSCVLVSCVTKKYWPGQAKGVREDEEHSGGLLSKMVLGSATIQKAGFWLMKKPAFP